MEDQARRLGASGLLPYLTGGIHATVVGEVAAGLQLFKRGLGGASGGPIFGPGVRVPGLTLTNGGEDWSVYEFPTLMQVGGGHMRLSHVRQSGAAVTSHWEQSWC